MCQRGEHKLLNRQHCFPCYPRLYMEGSTHNTRGDKQPIKSMNRSLTVAQASLPAGYCGILPQVRTACDLCLPHLIAPIRTYERLWAPKSLFSKDVNSITPFPPASGSRRCQSKIKIQKFTIS